MNKQWWMESCVYQVYPRSFKDSNNDGIGDLNGIRQKLDYIKLLGANVIWLSPIYDSPNADNGYDIRDYRKIMKEFGTMEDFDNLISEAHQKGLKIVMDLVVNHTSDENEWFIKSKQSPENTYRNYYIWKDGKNGAEPNNWGGVFGGSTWEYDKSLDKYYFHLFATKQPDLNWENPDVRKDVYKMMTWWLDKGVDGFRMDVINAISKDQRFLDGKIEKGQKYGSGWDFVSNGPRVHEFLQEMNHEVLSKYNIMTVGETGGVTTKEALKYAGLDRQELNMVFQFEHIDLGCNENGKWNNNRVKASDLKPIIKRWQTEIYKKGWYATFWGNHDQPRSVSRFGNDGKFRNKSAKMLATILFTLMGTPFIFQGEEIGMTNVSFNDINEFRDIETFNTYKELSKSLDHQKVMEFIRAKSRDNARTPMQWDDKDNAGFSKTTPWIEVNSNYNKINVKQNLEDTDSIFYYYKNLIELRKNHKTLIYGTYIPILEENENVIGYLRESDKEKLLVLVNFSEFEVEVKFPENIAIKNMKVLTSNYDANNSVSNNSIKLRPYESIIYSI